MSAPVSTPHICAPPVPITIATAAPATAPDIAAITIQAIKWVGTAAEGKPVCRDKRTRQSR
ncbi:hypothetical protein GCM10027287_16160 [Bordetella muralis]